MNSIFSKIVRGEIPCHRVAETNDFLAFLDINPNSIGHTLCVPKKEIDKVFDMKESDYLNLMAFSRRVAKTLESLIPCKRIGLSIIGLEVPHTHVHLIPLHSMSDATFKSKVPQEDDQLKLLAQRLEKKHKELFPNNN